MRDTFRHEITRLSKKIRAQKPRRKAPEKLPAHKIAQLSHQARYLHLAYCCLLKARPKDVPLDADPDPSWVMAKYETMEKNATYPPDWKKVRELYDKIIDKSEGIDGSAVYVLVDRGMSKSQYPVQTGHAVAQLVFEHKDHKLMRHWVETDRDLIVLGSEDASREWYMTAYRMREQECWTMFYDEDQHTSTYACGPISREKAKKLFGELDLL